MMLTKITD